MCQKSGNTQVFCFSECFRKSGGILVSDANAAHAGVDLYMNVDPQTALGSIDVENVGRIEVINNRCQLVLDDKLFLPQPKRAKTKYGPRNACLSQFNAF